MRWLAALFFSFSAISIAGIAAAVEPERASLYESVVWKKNTLSVCWENVSGQSEASLLVKRAVNGSWAKHSALKFSGWQKCIHNKRYDIRILVVDGPRKCGNSVVAGPHTCGLGSLLEDRPNGMVLNFTFEKWGRKKCQQNKRFCIKAIAIHEFGHAIGFTHEHNRKEKPKNCLHKRAGTIGTLDIGEYDKKSVMNYCAGYKLELSDGDKVAVGSVYPPSDAVSDLRLAGGFTVLDNRLTWIARDGNPTMLGSPVWTGQTSIVGGDGLLAIVQNSKLHVVEPSDGSYSWFRNPSFDPSTRAAFDGVNYYHVRNGKIYSFNVTSQNLSLVNSANWDLHGGIKAMDLVGGELLVFQGAALHRVSINSDYYRVIGSEVWSGDILAGTHKNTLYVIQNGVLHRVSASNGNYQVMPGSWAGASSIGSMGNDLVIVKDDVLYLVDENNGDFTPVEKTSLYLSGHFVALPF